MRIGIIGLGRLGSALAKGLDKNNKYEIAVYNRTKEKTAILISQTKNLIEYNSAKEIIENCGIIFLWLNAKDSETVLAENAGIIKISNPVLVSCSTGTNFCNYTKNWVSCFPNINIAVGKGVTLLTQGNEITDQEYNAVKSILESVGSVYEVKKAEMVLYGAMTSCGPAIFSVMLEQLADIVSEKYNFNKTICRKMVFETVNGTIELQKSEELNSKDIVYRVAHPGGSTEGGVKYLMENLPKFYKDMLISMKK